MKAPLKLLCSSLLLGAACSQDNTSLLEPANWNAISKTWSGAAEVNHYKLKQNRYDEIREGEAVLIFVREPFLKDRHVKDEWGKGGYQVLKVNFLREFQTGAYPYRTMMSAFQPLEENSAGKALKTTTSAQEWCGHVFVQTNRRGGQLQTEVKSYFEKEDGTTFQTDATTWLEDEIWAALRVDPKGLPVGSFQMIPSHLHSYFYNHEPKAAEVNGRWLAGKKGKTLIYEITYSKSGRTLAIEIQKKIPYAIQSWVERSGTQKLLSEGKLIARESNFDYWNYGGETKGKKLRQKLKLRP